jgi:predicted nucleotidyltransferase
MSSPLTTLAEQLHTSHDTLARAAASGLVRGQRRGERRFTLAPGEPEILSKSWPVIESLRRAFRNEPSVGAAILFGSYARGEARPDSDVDLLVHFRTRADLMHLEALRERLTRRVGHDVDLYSDDELGSQPVAMLRIATEGRPVIDREGYWIRLRRRLPQLQRSAAATVAVWAGR